MTARTDRPFDPHVVAPWTIGEGDHGVLFVHGFASTPPEMRRIGEVLATRGFRCTAPLLAGHGITPHALATTTWHDWTASAQDALDVLASECSDVAVVGQSMGGAIALHLAATNSTISAVACLSTPLRLDGFLPRLLPLAHRLIRWYHPRSDIDLYNPDAVEELYSYGLRSTHAINELRKLLRHVDRELATIRQPVLVLQGGRDRTVPPRVAEQIVSRLICSAHVEMTLYPRSGHGMSVDIDRDAIAERIALWCAEHSAAVTK